MGFLDHLFSSGNPSGAAPGSDAHGKGEKTEPSTQATQPPRSKVPKAGKLSTPRAAEPSTTNALSNDFSSTAPPESTVDSAPAARTGRSSAELVLTVEEILPHLPTEAIKPGLHDADQIIEFGIEDLCSDIARGRAAMLLSKLAELRPELVYAPGPGLPNQPIRLPLQKIVEQLNTSNTSAATAPFVVELNRSARISEVSPVGNEEKSKPEVPLAESRGDLLGSAATAPVWLGSKKKSKSTPNAPTNTETSDKPTSTRTVRVRPAQNKRTISPSPKPLTNAFLKRAAAVPRGVEEMPRQSPEASRQHEAEDSSIIPSAVEQKVDNNSPAESDNMVSEAAKDETMELNEFTEEITASPSVCDTNEAEAAEHDQPSSASEFPNPQVADADPTPVLKTPNDTIQPENEIYPSSVTIETLRNELPIEVEANAEVAEISSVDPSDSRVEENSGSVSPIGDVVLHQQTADHAWQPSESDLDPSTTHSEPENPSLADSTSEIEITVSASPVADVNDMQTDPSVETSLREMHSPLLKVVLPIAKDQEGQDQTDSIETDVSAAPISENPLGTGSQRFSDAAPLTTSIEPVLPESTAAVEKNVPQESNLPNVEQSTAVSSGNDPLVNQPPLAEMSEPLRSVGPSVESVSTSTVPFIPAPPRIRPPAPPPPVLVTPAAGLREAISHASTGGEQNSYNTALHFGGVHETKAKFDLDTAPAADAAIRRGISSQSSPPMQVPDSAITRTASGAVEGRDSSESSAKASDEVITPSPTVLPQNLGGVRPPPIQFHTPKSNPIESTSDSADKPSDDHGHRYEPVPVTPAITPQAPEALTPSPATEPVEPRLAAETHSEHWPAAPLTSVEVREYPSPTAAIVAAPPTSASITRSTHMSARSLSLFSQENLQALFMTEDILDVTAVARHVAALPGMHACALFAGDEAAKAGEFPSGFDLEVIREMGVQFVSTASVFGGRLMGGEIENVTIQGGGFSVTLFARMGLCLCVVHRAKGFLPGVREKLAAVANELSRGV